MNPTTTIRLSPRAQALYEQLQQGWESLSKDPDGNVWGSVYLGNYGDTRSFAGLLSTLKRKGLYKPMNSDDRDDRFFGWVKLDPSVWNEEPVSLNEVGQQF